MVGDPHRHGHLRAAGDADGQRRRGRHHGPAHAAAPLGPEGPHPHGRDPVGSRRAGSRAVPRRQHDHPGDLRALRGRGSEDDQSRSRRVGGPDHGHDPPDPLPHPEARKLRGRPALRADHGVLVRGRRRAGYRRHPARSPDPARAAADLCDQLHDQPFPHRLLRARRGGPLGHRRRGALRGHGPLRSQADLDRVAVPRVPGARADVPRAGRAAPGGQGEHVGAVLPARARVEPHRPGRPGHGGDRDRVAGGDLRCVLGRGAGVGAGVSAAAAGDAHLVRDARPDLRALDQLAAHGVGDHPGVRLPQLRVARLRLRDGGHRHDHDHHPAVLLSRPATLEDAGMDPRDRCGGIARDRPAVPRRQRHQVRARRLAAAGDRPRRLHRHDDVAARTRADHRASHRGGGFADGVREQPAHAPGPHRPRARHRDLPQPGRNHDAARAARQRRAQPRASRPGDHPVRGHPEHPPGAAVEALHGRRSRGSYRWDPLHLDEVRLRREPGHPACSAHDPSAQDAGMAGSRQRHLLPVQDRAARGPQRRHGAVAEAPVPRGIAHHHRRERPLRAAARPRDRDGLADRAVGAARRADPLGCGARRPRTREPRERRRRPGRAQPPP
ncbi:hypothetical protein MICRO8M_30155 [Microbacterium sp. 8M]|nr:hypothetical protein MICRO8M_30155 [Microbacterium sp. 8M]